MRILGIDPGLNTTGYGVIEAEGGQFVLQEAGAIRPSPRQPLAQRLRQLHEGLSRVIRTALPQLTVLEAVFVHYQHVTTAALMAHARAVACLVSAQHDIPVVEYLPTRIKKALTGHGAASKDQVAKAVALWLGKADPAWLSDTTDALALAIAHAHISRVPAALQPLPRSQTRRATSSQVAG
ncbi:MAG: crossover junction endodeoxyribonuclease RuvC [Candidatus Omnitrophica bacterium]|nr:crossover junction endodeoxyribonuclease RuvC [Candidatus Omnitrophota bacterium]